MLEFEKNLFVALALLVMGVGCILIGSFVNDFYTVGCSPAGEGGFDTRAQYPGGG